MKHHNHGLQFDLKQLLEKRTTLKLLGSSAAMAFLSACDGGPFGSGAQAEVVAKDKLGNECVLHPAETAGPFPADGSNNSQGILANALKHSGILRTDMTTNLDGSGTPAPGTPLSLEISLVDVMKNCEPLKDHLIYLWHCDAEGAYSIYQLPEASYLRAASVTDKNGIARFNTIFPGCYRGRFPHMHFEIYPSLEQATNYKNAILTSQLAMPESTCEAVYSTDAIYQQSKSNYQSSPLARDGIFADNTKKQLASQTPVITGDASTDLKAKLTIGTKTS